MNSKDKDEALVDKVVEQLGEHFDTVQIFVTCHESGEEGGTVSCINGSGNYYARVGLVNEWLTKEDEKTREYMRPE